MDLHLAKNIAEKLLQEEVLKDWSFRFDFAKKRFGQCNYSKKEITLSRYLTELNNEKTVTDTIIHEIAHAISGYDAGHGEIWKKCVKRMGGVAERCYSGENVKTPTMKYSLICTHCNNEIPRARKPKKRILKTDPACLECCKKYNNGKFSNQFLLTLRENY